MILALALSLPLLLQETASQHPKRDEFQRIEITLTAISGSSVYLDHGREAGLEPGDRMRVFPLDGSPRLGRVTSVSRTSARAEVDQGVQGLDIGLTGEVWIPRKRLERLAEPTESPAPAADATEAAPGTEATPTAEPEAAEPEPGQPAPRVQPDHPPWTCPPEEWNNAQPLLAPAHGQKPEERPRRFDGRVYTTLDWTKDGAGGVDRKTYSGTLGFDGRVDNPWGHGGRLSFDAEAFGRRFDSGGVTENDSKLRVNRASYAWGGVRGAPDRGEVGRFLQSELPALGFLDGAEYVHQIDRRDRVGASLGYLPIPDDLFRTGDDLQTAFFYRRSDEEDRIYSVGAGYQKTWHKGAADRDLFVGELEYHPGIRTSIVTTALVDWYTSGDDLKSAGPELTQLFVNATHRTEAGSGVGLFLSRFRWPQLLRNEFPDVTAQEIANSVSTRYGTDGWLALGAHTQLYGRVDAWSDQDDSGGGGRARVTWRDVLSRGDMFLVETFVNSSKFTQAVGLRTSTRRRFEHGSWDLSWDATNFSQDGVQEDLLQHAVRGGFDVELGRSWYLSLYAETRFGDEQDALSLGFLLQRSFD